MICPNCGNEIAITAKFCPHCRADTVAAGQAHAVNMLIGVPLVLIGTAIGSVIGFFADPLLGTFFGAIVGLVVSLPVAAIIGTTMGNAAANRNRNATPPQPPQPFTAIPPYGPFAPRLRCWCVTGADTASGVDRKVTIEAVSEDDACEQANRSGILVSECKCLTQDATQVAEQNGDAKMKVIAGTNTLLFAMGEADAHSILCDAINRVGKVKAADLAQHRIQGRVSSGKNATPVTATTTGLDSKRTMVTLDAHAVLWPGMKASARGDMATLIARLNPESAQQFVCRPKVNWTYSIVLGIIFIPLLAFGLPAMIGEFRADSAKRSTPAPAWVYEVPTFTFEEVDADFCPTSQQTELQKEASRKLYVGKKVTWTGVVEDVTEREVSFKHKASTLTSDVRLELAASARSDLSSLRKGMMVTYEGTIKDVAGMLLPHHLINGRIVSRKRPTDHERTMFLLNTEGAVEKASSNAGRKP